MYDIVWTKRMLGAFRQETCLSEDEEIVLEDWANKKSLAFTSMNRHMSVSKVKCIRSRLRTTYDMVQPYTPELPKRK